MGQIRILGVKMNLKQVHVFVLAAEKLNISEAGRMLGLAPAVASNHLANLEKGLGVTLLQRTTRKVRLSKEGAEFLPYAKELLAHEKAARAALGLGTFAVSGTLRFTAHSGFTQMYIAPLLPEFMDLHPKIKLDLHLSDTFGGPISGSYDLALINGPRAGHSVMDRKLADDRQILCASPSYLDSNGFPDTPDELNHHQLIGHQNQPARNLSRKDGSTGVFDPQAAGCRLVLNDELSQKAATVNGAGISMNSLWCVHQEIREGTLTRILSEYDIDGSAALWLSYPKSNILTSKVRVFIDYLIRKIGRSPIWEL